MFDDYDFRVEQLLSLKAAMGNNPSFQPDGEDAAAVQTRIDAAESIRDSMQEQVSVISIARGELAERADELHELCVQVYAILKSRFRQDVASYDSITSLPVEDKTPAATFERAQAISKLWELLPNPPGSAVPFTAWDGMGSAEFDAKVEGFDVQLKAMAAAEQAYEQAQGDFRAHRSAMTKWIGAALVQGRGQFPKGTPAREQIDAVPTRQQARKPAKATIVHAVSPGVGMAALKFECRHATSFRLLHQGPGATDYSILAEVESDVFEGSGFAAGVHRFKVRGRNSRGLGAESDPAEVAVAGG